MYRRILVPLDGSPFGDYALPWATAIARHTGAELDLVHAHQFHQSASELESITPYRYELVTEIEEILDGQDWTEELGRLRRIAEELRAKDAVRAGVRVIHGPAAPALAADAADIGADLVVMSTHGAGGRISQLWVGSVADHLIRHVDVPVLLVRPPKDPGEGPREVRFEDVLVPLDGSTLAESVLPSARLLGYPFASRLTLLRVLTKRHWPLNSIEAQLESSLEKEMARAMLEQTRRRVEADWVDVETAITTDVDVARGILSAAEATGADLIALATHGRSGVGRAVLGSVAIELMRSSPIPLLLLGPAVDRKLRREQVAAQELARLMVV